ncbi:glycosyltransferase family 2 protein [Synechococcus sp. PCC 7336]|uniref:glycosyltransferase family 2 protein n=1 Tax=Synechococcus sp. PCC 7336 TaxID=195250 RepID=UPI000345B67D|nr:glycosyltransferase [Synechococcus sp. PCC 7336]
MSQLLFSVVVPTYQRIETLATCLDCLAPGAQTLPSDRYEVIVTDDGREITAEAAIRERYPWAKWYAAPQRGPAANRNNGAARASGQWLVFTDDDCLPDPGWLEAYASQIARNREAGSTKLYRVLEGKTYAPRPRRSLDEESPVNETGGNLWSCNFAIERSLFEELSGFNTRFPYAAAEDIDLHWRLRQRQESIAFVEAASVCHPWRPSGGWKAHLRYKESILIYLALHPEERQRLNPRHYLKCCGRALLKELLPGLLKYKAVGWQAEIVRLLGFLDMAYILIARGERAYPDLEAGQQS